MSPCLTAGSIEDLREAMPAAYAACSDGEEVGRLYQRLPRWGKETAEVTRRILVSGPEVELVSWDTRTLPHRYLVRVLDGEAHRFEVVQ